MMDAVQPPKPRDCMKKYMLRVNNKIQNDDRGENGQPIRQRNK